jgi:hypothetical protein
MALTFNVAEIEIDETTEVVVSTIQPDADLSSSAYVRLIQIFTDPKLSANRRPLLTIRLFGGNQQNNDTSPLQISVPADTF